MNIDFFSCPLEKAIVEEIMRWSADDLEKPRPFFNGLPRCPYAREAWLDDRVAILFKHDQSYQGLYSCLSRFDDKFDLAIIVDLANDKDPDAFHEYWEGINNFISEGVFIDRDVWVMGFHPDDEAKDLVSDVDVVPSTDPPYAMIFVQRLSKLHESSDKLDKKGYYDTYNSPHNSRDVYDLRKRLYGELKSGEGTKLHAG